MPMRSSLVIPLFAAVSGKSRVYKPEGGQTYVSIRPELVKVVDVKLRDYWVLESCQSLKKRLEAAKEAYRMDPPTVDAMRKLGYSSSLSAGLVAAVPHYGKTDLSRYSSMLAEAVRYLLPEFQGTRAPEAEEVIRVEEKAVEKPKEKTADDKLEEEVLALIEQLDQDGKGASWDAILEGAKNHKVDRDRLEEIVNSLLDKGQVYEPVLGRMKKI